MKLDSSGNVLVGKTATNSDANGVELLPNGTVYITANNTLPFYINRRGTSGANEMARFSDDGSTKGKIGTNQYGEFNISSEANLTLTQKGGTDKSINFGTDHFGPFSGQGGTVDLGRASAQWKDLHLSGGVVFGTGGPSPITSNTLDDYEEGTFAPAMTLSTPGNSSFAYLAQSGQYRKVGNIVTFTLELRMNVVSYGNGSGTLTITGLPFNFANTGGYGASLCNVAVYGTAIASGRTPFASGISQTTNLQLLGMASGVAFTTLVVSNYNTIQVSGTYITP